jgi:hypothetical protein
MYSYPLGEITSSNYSYPLGEIEPTRSHLKDNGIYTGQIHKSPVLEYCDSRSKFFKFKDKFKQEFKTIEKKMD